MTIKETDTQEFEKVTNKGMCIFIGCQGKATGWIYNLDCSHDKIQMLHACEEHVKLFQCDEDRRKELFGI